MEQIDQLAADFQLHEGPESRGPRFERLLLGIESEMFRAVITPGMLLNWIGPPDLFEINGDDPAYVYFFDHHDAGSNRDEWYLRIKGGRLVASGYNAVGINDLSGLRPQSEFDADLHT